MTDPPESICLSSILAYAHETEALANDLAIRSVQALGPDIVQPGLRQRLPEGERTAPWRGSS